MSYPPYQPPQNTGANPAFPYGQPQQQQQYGQQQPAYGNQPGAFYPGGGVPQQQQPTPNFQPYQGVAPGQGQMPYQQQVQQQQPFPAYPQQQPNYGPGPQVGALPYSNAPMPAYPAYNQQQPLQQPQQNFQPAPGYPSSGNLAMPQQQGFYGQQGYASSPYPNPSQAFGTGTGFGNQSQPFSYPSTQPTSNLGEQTPAKSMTQYQGTVRPAARFNASDDAEALRKAMKGIGCNDKEVMNVLCHRSNDQRQQIRQAFKTMFGKDLINELLSELKGNFEDLIVALLYAPEEFDARELDNAMRGVGTTESTLIEIMTTRTNKEIQSIKYAYKMIYHSDLERDLSGETSGHFRRLLVSLSVGGRDESGNIDRQRAAALAKQLYDSGENCWGTDESAFNGVMVMNSPEQLQAIFEEYRKLTGHEVEQAINGEFSGDIRDGMIALVKIARNRPAYFAEKAYLSMKGMGTNDRALIRVIVSRCEKEMVQIKQEYQRLYSTSLENAISGDTSGKYKEGLLALICG